MRTQAFTTLDGFIRRVKDYSDAMQQEEARRLYEENAALTATARTPNSRSSSDSKLPNSSSVTPTIASKAGEAGWANWAVSQFSKAVCAGRGSTDSKVVYAVVVQIGQISISEQLVAQPSAAQASNSSRLGSKEPNGPSFNPILSNATLSSTEPKASASRPMRLTSPKTAESDFDSWGMQCCLKSCHWLRFPKDDG